MKILVTGGAGYIGSHTIVELIQSGYDVVCGDNFSNSKDDVFDSINYIIQEPVRMYYLDCANQSQMAAISKAFKFDAIIHFAGYKSVSESIEKPLKYYKNNLDSLLNVLNYFPNVPVVFSSSCTIYGNPDTLPITEDAEIKPMSPYGQTKVMCEQILKDRGNAICLRYFNPIGARPSGLIGENPTGEPQNLLPYLTQVASGKRDKLKIYGNDYGTLDGTCIRDYIYVVDLAKAHIKALEKLIKKPIFEVYNLGTGKGVSVLEMVSSFEEATGIKVPYEIAPRRAGDIKEIYADSSKANKELDWKAETPLTEILETAWKWEKNKN